MKVPWIDSSKIWTESSKMNYKRIYYDETLVSFFRRLSFTPDGLFLITPTGILPSNLSSSDSIENANSVHCVYLYNRASIERFVFLIDRLKLITFFNNLYDDFFLHCV